MTPNIHDNKAHADHFAKVWGFTPTQVEVTQASPIQLDKLHNHLWSHRPKSKCHSEPAMNSFLQLFNRPFFENHALDNWIHDVLLTAEESHHECQIIDLLANPFSRPSSLKRGLKWLVNTTLGTEETQAQRYSAALKTLVINIGFKNSFALLAQGYLTARCSNGDPRPPRQADHLSQITFGKLIKQLAAEYPLEYKNIDLGKLTLDESRCSDLALRMEKSAANGRRLEKVMGGIFIAVIGFAAGVKVARTLTPSPVSDVNSCKELIRSQQEGLDFESVDCNPPNCLSDQIPVVDTPPASLTIDVSSISVQNFRRELGHYKTHENFDQITPMDAYKIFDRFGTEFIQFFSKRQLESLFKQLSLDKRFLLDQGFKNKLSQNEELAENTHKFNPFSWWKNTRESLPPEENSQYSRVQFFLQMLGPDKDLDSFIENLDCEQTSFLIFNELFLSHQVGLRISPSSINNIPQILDEPKRRFALLPELEKRKAVLRFGFEKIERLFSKDSFKKFLNELDLVSESDDVFNRIFESPILQQKYYQSFFLNRDLSKLSQRKIDLLFPPFTMAMEEIRNGERLAYLTPAQIHQIINLLSPQNQKLAYEVLHDYQNKGVSRFLPIDDEWQLTP